MVKWQQIFFQCEQQLIRKVLIGGYGFTYCCKAFSFCWYISTMISFFCWRILNWFSTWLFSPFRVAIACSSSWCCSVAKHNGLFRKRKKENRIHWLHVYAIKWNMTNVPSSDFLVFSSFSSLVMKRSRSSSTTVRVVWTWKEINNILNQRSTVLQKQVNT